MQSNSSHIVKIPDTKPNIAVFELGNNVMGGNEALGFTSDLHELLEKGFIFIILDCTKVEMINSSGLGMLVSGHSTCKRYNASFALSAISNKILKLLEMTHLDKVLHIYENTEQAINDN